MSKERIEPFLHTLNEIKPLYHRKILWDEGYETYTEKVKYYGEIACHKVKLECGHVQIYRHTGVIFKNMHCKECEKKDLQK